MQRLYSINWDEVQTCEEQHHENISVNISDENDKFELANAKLEELERWNSNHIYEVVSNEGQDFCYVSLISLNSVFPLIK